MLRRPWSKSRLRVTALGGVTLTLLGAGVAAAGFYPGSGAAAEPTGPDTAALSAATADQFVTGESTGFDRAPGESFTRKSVVTTESGLNYVNYSRTYQNLRVFVGGDVVVVTDRAGAVRSSTAGSAPIKVSTKPKVTSAKAASVVRKKHAGKVVGAPALGVVADDQAKLVWEVIVEGESEGLPSRRHAYVDAHTGRYVGSWDQVSDGTGNGHYNGKVQIGTTRTGSQFELRDASRGGMRTLDDGTGRGFTDADDVWGNGSGTDRTTAAVDTQYAGAAMWDMLKAKFNRDGIDDRGGTATMFVGLDDVNAYYSCASTSSAGDDESKYGHTSDNSQQINSIDVVAHELGHGVFCHTPGGNGGTSNETGGLNEGTGDIFGAMAEHFAANPSNPADYLVGEEVDLVGSGPIRNMVDPSQAGDPNCWSSAIPNTEVHSAAGPLNHWFYLTAEGSRPASGPASPTCDNSTVKGIGIWAAGDIFYHALLRKTSGWTYSKVRKATLEAAIELHPDSCADFNAVKAAWNAVSVPSRQDPTCTVTSTPTSAPTSAPTSPAPSRSSTPSPAASTTAPTAEPGIPDIDGAKVKAHLTEFDRIAKANGGTRANGTAGFQASLDYVKGKLDAAGYTTRIQQFTRQGITGKNLIADLPGRGDQNHVVMLGAHLDSVEEGPGINDNGSGSAGILQIALDYAAGGANGAKAIRFGWWDAEEEGLVGSKSYVAALSTAQKAKLDAYLNFDMTGSPNAGYFVYNDDSRGDFVAAALRAGFAAENVQPEGVDIDGRSDHASFLAAGIPTGGTATLSLAPTMSAAQAAKWGGKARQPFDSCYHKACDTLANVNDAALDTHTDAAAFAAWQLTGVTAPAPTTPAPTTPQPTTPQPAPGGTRLENPADFAIADSTIVESPITAQLTGSAPKTLKVEVDITHSFRGDLQIDLIAPDGSAYRLKSSNRLDSADGVKGSFAVDAAAERAAGTWKLRVRDRYTGDTGVLNSWALTF